MPKHLDTAAFFPDIPDGASAGEGIRILQDSLARIHEQLAFALGNIKYRDLSASARRELIAEAKREIVTGLLAAKRWSDYPEGEVIPEGAFVWYKGELWECRTAYGRYAAYAPDSAVGGEFWEKVT